MRGRIDIGEICSGDKEGEDDLLTGGDNCTGEWLPTVDKYA